MAEIQQPNIVGNFLAAYSSGLERQQQQQDAAYQRQRQAKADQMTEQKYAFDMDAGQLDMALKRASAMNEILAGVDERNEQTLEVAKQRYMTSFGGRPEDVASITMADIPRIKMQTGQLAQELNAQLIRARIGTEQAQGRAANALAGARRMSAAGGGGSYAAAGPAQTDSTYSAPDDPAARPTSFMDSLPAKEQADIRKRAASDFSADRKATEKEIAKARETLSAANRFEQLLKTQETGGMYGAPVIGGIIRGAASMTSPEVAEMESITAKLVPTMREPGSGSSSDSDMRMFERATLGIDKPTGANKAIASGMKAAAQNMIDYGLFKQKWYQKHGMLLGSAEAWQRYLDENTIFDQDSNDFELNKSRVPWRDYFASLFNAGNSAALPASPPAASRGASAAGSPVSFEGFTAQKRP